MKKLKTLLVLTAGLLLAADAPKEDPLQAEKKQFEGTWSLVSVEINGKAVAMDTLKEARLVVKGDKYSFTLGEMHLELTHKPDPTKKPKTLDLTFTEGPNKGKTFQAIYTLEKGQLKICRHLEPGMERPTEFATKPDSGLMVIVWKRDKP
jgi:uncharacterized protein (TIGR03067 family)